MHFIPPDLGCSSVNAPQPMYLIRFGKLQEILFILFGENVFLDIEIIQSVTGLQVLSICRIEPFSKSQKSE